MSRPPPAEPAGRNPEEPDPTPRPRRTSRQREAGAASRAVTRQLLVTAAGELFAERGYTGATVSAIADRAGVSLQTLYLAWGSKRQLLRAFMEQGLSGSPTAVTDDSWAELARSRVSAGLPPESDPQAIVHGIVGFFRSISERAALGWKLYRDAAAIDPEIRADQNELASNRRQTVTAVMNRLPDSALRPGLSREDAIDTVMVVMGPESYHLLVEQFGYSLDRYERWVTQTLTAALLEPEPNRSPGPRSGR
jgi:AcrR family transcriptional regulator